MKPSRITVHCTDAPNGRPNTVEEIRSWHRARGMKDIGYHFVIYPDGSIHEGRPLTEQGAHVQGENEDNVGIVMDGKDKFSPEQWVALRSVITMLLNGYPIEAHALYCHNEFPSAKAQGKTCPNFEGSALRGWYFTKDDAVIHEHILEVAHA